MTTYEMTPQQRASLNLKLEILDKVVEANKNSGSLVHPDFLIESVEKIYQYLQGKEVAK